MKLELVRMAPVDPSAVPRPLPVLVDLTTPRIRQVECITASKAMRMGERCGGRMGRVGNCLRGFGRYSGG